MFPQLGDGYDLTASLVSEEWSSQSILCIFSILIEGLGQRSVVHCHILHLYRWEITLVCQMLCSFPFLLPKQLWDHFSIYKMLATDP